MIEGNEEVLDILSVITSQSNEEIKGALKRAEGFFSPSQLGRFVEAVRDTSYLTGLRDGLRLSEEVVKGGFLGEKSLELPSGIDVTFIARKKPTRRAARYRLTDDV